VIPAIKFIRLRGDFRETVQQIVEDATTEYTHEELLHSAQVATASFAQLRINVERMISIDPAVRRVDPADFSIERILVCDALVAAVRGEWERTLGEELGPLGSLLGAFTSADKGTQI
jgi:hypothetical protein